MLLALWLVLPAFAFAQTPNAPAAPAEVQQQAAPAPNATPTPTVNPAAPTQASPTAAAPTASTTQPPASQQSAAPASPVSSPPENDIRFKLPHDLSPWGMFLSADVVVKAVMIGLAFASLLTWTIWLAKSIELVSARVRLRRAIASLGKARSWDEATSALQGSSGDAGALVRAADEELRLSAGALADVKERISSRLERIEAAGSRSMIRGTGVLATVGATAPFVGLFGTVWGIMNSFIGISKQHTTNLAVVAPGIAEALLATALGLVAAIPAVVMYNLFARWNAGYRAQQADASAAILRLISRDLDRGTLAQRPPAGPRAVTAAE